MTHLIKRGQRFYYNRRVPEHVRQLDKRDTVRVALAIDSRTAAVQKATILNQQIEAYWAELLASGISHTDIKFRKAVAIAQTLGFGYQPMPVIASLPIEELAKRVMAAIGGSASQVAAVLGGHDEPDLTVSKALDKFWGYSKDRILNKSANQIKKWERPRNRAVEKFIKVIGDKEISSITRDDIIRFRDWWLARIKDHEMSTETANKDFIHLKNILETVSDNKRLGIDFKILFKKIVLKDRFATKRLPLTNDEIITILNDPKLHKLNEQARLSLFVAADTGARPAEIVGLQPEDIHLNCEIPYISIKDRPGRPLKTAHSERDIPLVGFALEAMKQLPNGFPLYRDAPDNLSTCVNKFLRENKLLPSKQHSVYSLRHSFQDRLTAVNAPERIQCELMGHKFHRARYGDGGSLTSKREWLNTSRAGL